MNHDDFARDVRAGLTATPKRLLPKYFYDDLGSLLFEAICHLPEYYLTRCEAEILRAHAAEMIAVLPAPVTLVELGSGSSIKTRLLIEAALARQGSLLYQPIEISEAILEQSASSLLGDYAGLRVNAQARDYTQGLGRLERPDDARVLALFLGSNLGNYDLAEQAALLRQVRQSLRAGDALLLGADLKKSPALLEAAYNDALGVTAAFNLNLLARINRELEADFDVRQFEHRALYNAELGRIETYAISRRAQAVHLRALNLRIDLRAGETIHTESSWKFDGEQLAALAAATGYAAERVWWDREEKFSCNLWRAI